MPDHPASGDFTGTGTATATVDSISHPAFGAFTGSGTARALARRTWGPRRIVICEADGSTHGELDAFTPGEIVLTRNGWEEANFTVAASNANAAKVTAEKFREAQVWLGDLLACWGPITRPQVDTSSGQLAVRVQGAPWYLGTRNVGSVGRLNRLTNPSFETGLTGWSQYKLHYFLDYAPIAGGEITTVANPTKSGGKALKLDVTLDPSHPDSNWGNLKVQQEFIVDGGDRGVQVTFVAWMYVPSGSFVKLTPDREPLELVRLPTDYRTNNEFTRTGAPNTWGGARGGYTEVIDVQRATVDNIAYRPDDPPNIPKDQWIQLETSITVPAGRIEAVDANLSGVCEGVTIFDACSVTFDDALAFAQTDQRDIIAGLVDHAQDTAFGKDDVNLAVSGAETGVLRDLVALFSEHANIWRLIQGYTELSNGVEVRPRYTPTARTLQVVYPNSGTPVPNLTLLYGGNVEQVRWTFNGDSAATSVIELGNGNGSAREEAGAVDVDGIANGRVVESIVSATDESGFNNLAERAEYDAEVLHDPEVLEVKIAPHDPTVKSRNIIGRLWPGDVVNVQVDYFCLQIEGVAYRVEQMRIQADDRVHATLNKVPS